MPKPPRPKGSRDLEGYSIAQSLDDPHDRALINFTSNKFKGGAGPLCPHTAISSSRSLSNLPRTGVAENGDAGLGRAHLQHTAGWHTSCQQPLVAQSLRPLSRRQTLAEPNHPAAQTRQFLGGKFSLQLG